MPIALLMLPLPSVNTALKLIEVPAVIVVVSAVKLLIVGAGVAGVELPPPPPHAVNVITAIENNSREIVCVIPLFLNLIYKKYHADYGNVRILGRVLY